MKERKEKRKMAIENPIGKRLTLKLSKGTDPETGKPIYTSVSISKIIPAAEADALLATANEIAGLLLYPLYDVQAVTTVELLEG
jgi:hypothetical protein